MEKIKMVVYSSDDTNVLVCRYRTSEELISYLLKNGIELIVGWGEEIKDIVNGNERIDILVVDYQCQMTHYRRPELLEQFRKNHSETKVVLYNVNKPEGDAINLYDAFQKSEYTGSPGSASVVASILEKLGILDEDQARKLAWNAPS